MKFNLLILVCLLAALAGARAGTVIPPEFAMPAGSVDTSASGFLVRPYQTAAAQPNSLAWTEDQLLGLHGPNLADLSGADANGYYTVGTVVNWNIHVGTSVDGFQPSDPFPGNTTGDNFSMEVLTYVEFPSAGDYTMGVNSDDGFRVAVASLTPKDRLTAVTLGQFDGGRGKADTLFSFTVTQPGIYPMRVIYEQGGGDANISWFNVVTNDTGTNFVLINDQATPGALNAYTTASVAPPYVDRFGHAASGFTFTIIDQISALKPASLQVTLNGSAVTVATQKTGPATVATYTAPALIASRSANTVSIHFTDDAIPPRARSVNISYVEAAYIALPTDAALPATAVDLTQRGFVYRVHQIDSGVNALAANIAHAEAQLAGLLTAPDGTAYADISMPGPEPDGSYIIDGIINFNLTPTSELGSLTSANGYMDEAFPGLVSGSGNNIAIEVVAYLDLQPGFYNFGVNSADGFRVALASNPYDAFGTTLGIFDFRRVTTETQFGVAVQKAGLYPVRLVFFRQSDMADNNGTGSLEFYTINADGSPVAVNDDTVPSGVKAYWKRTAGYDTFVKYAGPTSFISPFTGPDVGFQTMNVVISDGSSAKVVAASVALSVDGQSIAPSVSSGGGLTTLSDTPAGLQLPRTIHTATVTYADDAGHRHTNTWSFNLLRNYELPAPLYFEDFESTDVGPDPMVPAGWVQENHTGHETMGFDPFNITSDFYLGFVVIDKSMWSKKDFVSTTAPQVLNGVPFDEATNPLMSGHCIFADSDGRQNGPPGQIQYLFTPPYNLSGKSGIVIAFNSSYEQNQDSMAALEYTTDGGTSWNPIFYWLQDGYDDQGAPDIIRDGLGNIDVAKTMLTSYGDVARYTDETTGLLVGGYYGFFIKAPVTPALEPYIEGRVNDDDRESKRIELFRVPKADNQKIVQFRFSTPGTCSWFWAVDSWGVYSVPSLIMPTLGPLHVALVNGKAVISWTGAGTLESTADFKNWTGVPGGGTSPVTITPAQGQKQFYRLHL